MELTTDPHAINGFLAFPTGGGVARLFTTREEAAALCP